MAEEDFENALTRGKAQYFTKMPEAGGGTIEFGLTSDPETGVTQQVLTFRGVTRFSSHWTDRDESSNEGLMGAHEKIVSGGFQYCLVTDQREIEIVAEQRAVLSLAG